MILHKEFDAGQKEKDKAEQQAQKQPWYDKEYPKFCLLLEDDQGERVKIHSFWIGYFETLVGGEIVNTVDDDMKFRLR
jgi:hypothetical protein